ncbi:SGNH/GDSL hydrolase family protein [Saccharothrix variisporea]|uniref:Acyl-CoA thioesterase-1 n=1 Tax=Saccharothrix variisporea TaxID=543527 RepID=A0A495X3P7_9PSEU|nr:GDSL-type esterase/lipase family protein [Saccharothrix variisporea]RKT67794.1 acyl-CoA thioesterase-1 [Saccharothrix variisporea]
MTTAERLVRFQQPEKSLNYLPGLAQDKVAALFDLTPEAHAALLKGFEDRARAAAESLLADPELARCVDGLPFKGHVVAIGESTTADRLSWFEILRHALRDRDVRLTNLAVSGSTTTQALTRLPALAFARADHVLCMLGGNDVQRIGGPRLVSREETERNLDTLRAASGVEAWTWLTPSRVDEERVRAYPHFQRAGLSWHNEDLDAIADHLASRPEPTVDTRPATSAPDAHLEDGVHLTVEGQQAVAAAVIRALAA